MNVGSSSSGTHSEIVESLDSQLSSMTINSAAGDSNINGISNNSGSYPPNTMAAMYSMHSANSFSAPQLNGALPNGGIASSSNHQLPSQHMHHQVQSTHRTSATTAALFAAAHTAPLSSSVSSSHLASSNNNLYHQQHDNVLSQQYIGATPHNLVNSDYGLKYNPSPKSCLSPKKHVNGLNGYHMHHHSSNPKHPSNLYAMQQHMHHGRGHEMAALNGVSHSSHHNMRRNHGNGMTSMQHASTNDIISSARGAHSSNFKATSGLHRLHHNQKERPPLLRHYNTGDQEKDTVLNQFRDTLSMLTWQPDAFDNLVPYLVGALNCGKVKPDTSHTLANILVSWSIAEENFRFTGAKLSHYLCLPEQLNFTFKDHFFASVRSEVDKMAHLIKQQSQLNHQKLEGVLLFICELYLNMGNVEIDAYGSINMLRIDFLRNALKDAMLNILELSPFDKPFLIVGKALKLTGAALDESDNCDADKTKSSSKAKTDRIYTHIQAIQQDSNTSQKVRDVYARVLELRRSKWASDEFRSSMSQSNQHQVMSNHASSQHLHHNQHQLTMNGASHLNHNQHNTQPNHHNQLQHHTYAMSSAGGFESGKKDVMSAAMHHYQHHSAMSGGSAYAHHGHHSRNAYHGGGNAHRSNNNHMYMNGSHSGARSSMMGQSNSASAVPNSSSLSHSQSQQPPTTSSYSSIAAANSSSTSVGGSVYHQNAATIANVTAEMPLDPVFFLSDGTAIPAHEAERNKNAAAVSASANTPDFEVSCDYDATGGASYLPSQVGEFFARVGESEMGPNAAGETDFMMMPNGGMMSEFDEDTALALYAESANGVDLMNGAGDMLGPPGVHTLTDEEEAAFSMFLQQSEQQQTTTPNMSMPPPHM